MITLRRAEDRGVTKLHWLDSRHTFSFGNYYDPKQIGYSSLRAINEDRVVPGAGFPTHSHRDMEIITYVLEGALAHKDSTGASSVIRVGEVQRMSAGTGISHSEYNASQTEPVHFLQIWIVPDETGLPRVMSRKLSRSIGIEVDGLSLPQETGALVPSRCIRMRTSGPARFAPGEQASFRVKPRRQAWVQMACGAATLNGVKLNEGDGAAISQEEILEFKAAEDVEIFLFDLA
jgi:quercetin 2,3-dioxygenase